MISIKIDKDLTAYMSSKKLRLDEVFVVICFSLNQTDLLRSALGGKTQDQLTAYFQSFERKMLLSKIMPELADFDWDNYETTEKSRKVFEDCSIYIIDGEVTTVIFDDQPGSLDKNQDDIFDKFIDEFVGLFPEGTRNGGGDYLRSNKKDVFRKMLQFMKKYPYDGPTILKATEHYIKQQSLDRYTYCNGAHFFIMKGGISKLATECEAILSNKGKNDYNGSWTSSLM